MEGLPNVNVKWSHHDARAAQQVIFCHEVKHALHIVFVCLLGSSNLYRTSLVQRDESMIASSNVMGS